MTKRIKRCLLCHKMFRNRDRLRDHLFQEHDVLPFKVARPPKKKDAPVVVKKKITKAERMLANKIRAAKERLLLEQAKLVRKGELEDAPVKVKGAAKANARRLKRERRKAMRKMNRSQFEQSLIAKPITRKALKEILDGQ